MKLLYYLAAIGPHHYNEKIRLFFHNIDYICNQLECTIDVIINMYGKHPTFIEDIHRHKHIDKVYVHYKKGILAELWESNPYHHIVQDNYDYVLFILDDVEIINVDVKDMIQMKRKHNLDILSPRVKNATQHWLMDFFQKDEYLLLVNMIEIYFLLITPKTFHNFMDVQDTNNKWIWGVDMMLGHFGFKCGIYKDTFVKHYYPNSNNNKHEAHYDMIRYLNKYGYSSSQQVMKQYPPILSRIKHSFHTIILFFSLSFMFSVLLFFY